MPVERPLTFPATPTVRFSELPHFAIDLHTFVVANAFRELLLEQYSSRCAHSRARIKTSNGYFFEHVCVQKIECG